MRSGRGMAGGENVDWWRNAGVLVRVRQDVDSQVGPISRDALPTLRSNGATGVFIIRGA